MSRLKGFTAYEGVAPVVTYAPAIQMLRKEHTKLRISMDETWKFAQSRRNGSSRSFFEQWQEMERQLRFAWAQHAMKEEQVLLSILSKYVDSDSGPLAVMRYEHERIEGLLDRFEQNIKLLLDDPSNQTVLEEALKQFRTACQLKGSHCFKEEKAIYPMAQTVLTDNEKLQLLHQLKKIK